METREKQGHTAGPWHADDGQILAPKDGGDVEVALVGTDYDATTDADRIAVDEARANARLIASAPDLLAVLRTLTAHAALYTGDGATVEEAEIIDESRGVFTLVSVVKLAREAIAKATGGAS